MSLVELADNTRTDKNTVHSYLPLYDILLARLRDTATNVLEIGIYQGGSIKLWHDYFPNATAHGIDVMHYDDVWNELKNNHRIITHTSSDAYDTNVVSSLFFSGPLFDMVLDDGPHTLESMLNCVRLYLPLIKDNGILIIEDVQDINWINLLKACVPNEYQECIEIYDLREKKGRYDDIVFTVDKSKKTT